MYLIYLCYFAAEGILYPFWPTWLKSLGYNNGEVGLLLAAAYWPQVLVGLGLAYLADWRFCQIRLAGIVALLSTLCLALFYLPPSTPLYLLLAMLYGGLWTAVLPLSEAYLLAEDKAAAKDYGRVRAAGSLAFIVLSIGGGWLLGLFGQGLVPGMIAALMLLTGLACFTLTRGKTATIPAPNKPRPPRPDWRLLRHHRALLLCLAAAGLIQLSHSLYFATASNAWAQQGYSSTWVGLFWAVAVLAEIAYFALSGAVLRRLAPLTVIMLSGLSAALRWGLAPLDGGMALILFGQLLHALSFAAYHSALMRYIRDHAPESLRNLTQGLYYSFAVALPMGLMTPLAGRLFDLSPSRAYGLMVVIALGGTLTAYLAHQRTGATRDTRTLFRRLL